MAAAAGIPIPGGAAGGGIGSVIIVVLFVVLTQCVGGGCDGRPGGRQRPGHRHRPLRAVQERRGREQQLRLRSGGGRELAGRLLAAPCPPSPARRSSQNGSRDLHRRVGTGCGQATADVGPFYCPTDQTIYLDTTFFDDVLQQQLGGPSGDFVEPYVLAHEYGHHIQNLLGTMGKVKTQQGPKSDAVRLELQADCYAGMWTKNATRTDDADGEVLIESLSEQDIKQAIDAATAVGDDRIQSRSGGGVNPEQWTHGSSAERVRWFQTARPKTSSFDG